MTARKAALIIAMFAWLVVSRGIALGEGTVTNKEERQEYERELKRIVSLRKSLSQDRAQNLRTYETFGDDISNRWRKRSRAHHARLMLAVCKPLSSGTFEDSRRYELARKYALSALEEANGIPLTLELELIGHVTTVRIGPGASRGEDFARHRKKDIAVRLHAWKRLIDAIDPNWDPDEVLWSGNVAPPAATGLPAGVEPDAIKDAHLRAEYEAAIQRNRQKAEEYREQYELHKWLKRFPKRAESDIVQAYSHPPFDIEELKEMLDDRCPDQESKARIVEAVDKNIREKKEGH